MSTVFRVHSIVISTVFLASVRVLENSEICYIFYLFNLLFITLK